MESEFVECKKQAELKNNMPLVIKGNGLKRKTGLKYSQEAVIGSE